MKKLATVLILLVAVAGIGGYGYYKFFVKADDMQVDLTATTNTTSTFPQSGDAGTLPSDDSAGTAAETQKPAVRLVSNGNLAQLASEPISGFFVSSSTLRYNDRKTGHFFEVNLASLVQKRISNTTIPNIYESLWSAKGGEGMLRYLKTNTETVQSYFFKLATSSLAYGVYLPENISTPVFAPTGSRIFYLTNTKDGTQGFIDNQETKKKSSVFTSPIREWIAVWPNETTITLTSKASSGVPGHLYFLNPQNSAMKRVLNNISGLTTLTSPKADYVLYTDSSLNLQLLNVKTGSTATFNIQTMPEKCVWPKLKSEYFYCAAPYNLPDAEYPDSWYQGTALFADSLYRINISTGSISTIITNDDFGYDFDITNLSISSDEETFFFTNKRDSTLWTLKRK